MIQISKHIQLKYIQNSDFESLFKLMKEIYSYTYSHFWKDKGDWYINSQYSKENLLKDLSEKKATIILLSTRQRLLEILELFGMKN